MSDSLERAVRDAVGAVVDPTFERSLASLDALVEVDVQGGSARCVIRAQTPGRVLRRKLAAAAKEAAEGVDSETVQGVLELARFRNLHVKLTFAVTGSDEDYPFRDTHPILKRLIEAFGPDRCMWGSDFPCELWLKKATYAEHLALFTDELGLSPAEQDAILGGTAMQVWFP